MTPDSSAFFAHMMQLDDPFDLARRREVTRLWGIPAIRACWIADREAERRAERAEAERLKAEIAQRALEEQRQKAEAEKRLQEERLAAERQARLDRERERQENARRQLLAKQLAEEQEAHEIMNELPEEERRQQERLERQRRKDAKTLKRLERARAVARARREAEIAEATAAETAEEARYYREKEQIALRRFALPSSEAPVPPVDVEEPLPDPHKSRGRVEYPTILTAGMFDKWHPRKGKNREILPVPEEKMIVEEEDEEGKEDEEDVEEDEEDAEEDEEDPEEDEEDAAEEKHDDDKEDDEEDFFESSERPEGTVINKLNQKFLASAGQRDHSPIESDNSGSDFEKVSAQEKRKRAQKRRRSVSDTEKEDNEEDAVLAKEVVLSSPTRAMRRRHFEAETRNRAVSNAAPAKSSTTLAPAPDVIAPSQPSTTQASTTEAITTVTSASHGTAKGKEKATTAPTEPSTNEVVTSSGPSVDAAAAKDKGKSTAARKTRSKGGKASRGGRISKETHNAAGKLAATVNMMVEDFAREHSVSTDVALKLLKLNVAGIKRGSNVWNRYEFVLSRTYPVEGETRDEFNVRATDFYNERTDPATHTNEEIAEFFNWIEKTHVELISDPANLKDPHMRANGITDEIRDMVFFFSLRSLSCKLIDLCSTVHSDLSEPT